MIVYLLLVQLAQERERERGAVWNGRRKERIEPDDVLSFSAGQRGRIRQQQQPLNQLTCDRCEVTDEVRSVCGVFFFLISVKAISCMCLVSFSIMSNLLAWFMVVMIMLYKNAKCVCSGQQEQFRNGDCQSPPRNTDGGSAEALQDPRALCGLWRDVRAAPPLLPPHCTLRALRQHLQDSVVVPALTPTLTHITGEFMSITVKDGVWPLWLSVLVKK